jgi:serine protease Do
MHAPQTSLASPKVELAKAGPGKAFSWRQRSGAAALAAAAVVTAFSVTGPVPALAEVKADSVLTPMGRAPLSFADIVEKVKPSVVSISVNVGGEKKMAEKNEKNDKGSRGGGGSPIPGMPELPEDHPLHEFFKNLPKDFGNQQEKQRQGQGSGFVITQDGYVVTNNHVIDGANKISVSFDEQEKYEADLIGTDPRTDIALLKIKNTSKTFPSLKFAEKPARVGDWVIAVGNPFGLGGTVTAGIVSALGRDIGSGPYDYLQIDAAVNRGNSGGPTFNLEGEVIGVNTAIYSPSGGNVGIAFAVPATTVTDVVKQLKDGGTVNRGWLGVKIQNVDEDTAASIGLTDAKGAFVSDVTPNGPAADAGLKAQDTITQVNGDKIADSRDLARRIADYAPDTTVDVKVWRNNSEQNVKVKLGRFPTGKEEIAKLEQGGAPAPEKESGTELEQLGLTLAPVRSASRDGAAREGVAIEDVSSDSDAAQKGLKAGDIILEVSGEPVSSAADVEAGVKKARDLNRPSVLLHVKSADQKRFVAVKMKKN